MIDGIPMPILVWVSIAVALIILEIFTAGFFFIFFAAGAVVSALAAILIDDPWVQFFIFLGVSSLLVFFTRPILKKTFNVPDKPLKESNMQALLNQPVLVLETVDRLGGKAKVIHTGEIWTAYLQEGCNLETLEPGTEGLIVRVNGAKLELIPRN